MPYTNYTHDFTGTIDYIFYTQDTIIPTGVLGPVDPVSIIICLLLGGVAMRLRK